MNETFFKKVYWLSLFDGVDKLVELRDRYEKYREENVSSADHRFLKILIGADYDPEDARFILDNIKNCLKIETASELPLDKIM
ncbi:hypothetical protein FACS189450_06360 [Spirochaetia bacterium]|nr:hypothetical protein FACS1894147_10100 [Spirochaetia bacterium]GHU04724.1 hypothetical protein FACS1894147_10150 [Spirochaetia bacterium]GHU71011.1 hypothetical protein FACS189450_06360 [Spirochaetia bacterium]